MKKNRKFDKMCGLCEHSEKICSGEYCICRIKGAVSPDGACRKFSFDPLKVEVSVRKLPEFVPIFPDDGNGLIK